MANRIPLTQGKFAIVDDADFEWLNQWNWFAYKWVGKCRTIFYARRNGRKDGGSRKTVAMHSQLFPEFGILDHKDGNGLNNRRSNLRPASIGQNNQNARKRIGCTSRFKGVTWFKSRSKWMAQIFIKGHHKNLGYFSNQQSAAISYDAAAEKYFGEFALTNKALNLI
jgi:AP2 domain